MSPSIPSLLEPVARYDVCLICLWGEGVSHVISERGMSRDHTPETAVRAARVRDDRRKERTIL